MKRIPGIKPRFQQCKIIRPDGSVLDGWEMFVGERSYGRSDSKKALADAWEARLAEAENARPFAFRPLRKRALPPARAGAAKRNDEATSRNGGNARANPPRAGKPRRKAAR